MANPPKKSIDDLNKGLGFGLNARGSGGAGGASSTASKRNKTASKKKKGASVFGDSDSSSEEDAAGNDDDTANEGGRAAVNAALRKEQEALRRRAEVTMAQVSSASGDVYSYDEGFDSFSSAAQQAAAQRAAGGTGSGAGGEKKSRYIGKLLQSSAKRQREHELIHERRIARDQAAEEKANALEFAGKEKFVTKSYKKKLAEREAFLREEAEKEEEERRAEADRREGRGDLGAASLLGSVVRRGEEEVVGGIGADGERKMGTSKEVAGATSTGGFTSGFSRSGQDGNESPLNANNVTADEYRPRLTSARRQPQQPEGTVISKKLTKEEEQAALRRKRVAMVVAARERYLERQRSGQTAALFATGN